MVATVRDAGLVPAGYSILTPVKLFSQPLLAGLRLSSLPLHAGILVLVLLPRIASVEAGGVGWGEWVKRMAAKW
ncbi:hypothetical protein AVEN_138540-1 [Araneus ventricosus]|uniref:Uncharacterized protein n=1 Tax=Araneus ventricosus TaxID=182803 RepID=A0A4Y2GKJ4_ARAVE|nr:hypothetical protein AVEN_138540-1 [Araneus ventricosus]